MVFFTTSLEYLFILSNADNEGMTTRTLQIHKEIHNRLSIDFIL
jgi:hypothetical protein